MENHAISIHVYMHINIIHVQIVHIHTHIDIHIPCENILAKQSVDLFRFFFGQNDLIHGQSLISHFK